MATAERVQVEVRPVTDEEVEHFWEYGWVVLRHLVSEDTAAALLDCIKDRMGDDGGSYVFRHGYDFDVGHGSELYRSPRRDYPLVDGFATAPEIGRNAARLLGRDSSIRLMDDAMLVKLPISKRPDKGQLSPFHQDSYGLDRDEVAVWMALDTITPEMGTMRFLNGSYALGRLGRFDVPYDEAVSLVPQIADLEMSPELTLGPGDATVHHGLCVHGSPANTGDRARWAYRLRYYPGDSTYLGAKGGITNGLGLQPYEAIDSPMLPVVYEPGV